MELKEKREELHGKMLKIVVIHLNRFCSPDPVIIFNYFGVLNFVCHILKLSKKCIEDREFCCLLLLLLLLSHFSRVRLCATP